MIYEYEMNNPKAMKVGNLYTNKTVGGMGPGKALNLKKLSFDSSLYSPIGNDQPGRYIKEYLNKNGIRFFYDYQEDGTNTHINVMDKNGDRNSIGIITPGCNYSMDFEKIERLIIDSDYICLNVNDFCRYAIPYIKKHKREIWCDLGDYENNNAYFDDFAKVSDYVTMSGSKLDNPQSVINKFIDDGKKQVVVTLGSEGSIGMDRERKLIYVPIINGFERIDTNGAGDTYFSAMLYCHSKNYSLEKSMRVATIAAGLTISSLELFNEKLSEEYLENLYSEYYL